MVFLPDDAATERGAPEARGFVDVRPAAIDDERAQSAAVHDGSSQGIQVAS